MKPVHFVAAAVCLCITHVQSAEYGVGFELSLDYGTASVFFKNGSVAEVAKIEGGPAYKQALRSPDALRTEGHLPQAGSMEKCAPLPRFQWAWLCVRLPGWLRGSAPCEPALTPMLRALQAATAAYLNEPVSAVLAAFSFAPSAAMLARYHEAARPLSLRAPPCRRPTNLTDLAALYAVRPYDVGDSWSDYEEQIVLSVEYSRAALTALLVHLEDDTPDRRRTLHEPGLGAAAAPGEAALAAALRPIVALPLADDGPGADLTHIKHVVLAGEAAADAQLQAALREVLKGQAESLLGPGRTEGVRQQTKADDPTFAGARAVAKFCWHMLQDEEFPSNWGTLKPGLWNWYGLWWPTDAGAVGRRDL